MPIYEYQTLEENVCPFAECGGQFEEIQGVNDAPLTECPACSAACRKLISMPAVKRTSGGSGNILSHNNLGRQGFAQYTKTGNDVWERSVGTDEQGPRILHKDGRTE
jgi:putative FmdB family regulatory protein